MEGLPAECQRESPDDDRADAVQDHPRCRTHLFGNADAGEIEERDAERYAWRTKRRNVK